MKFGIITRAFELLNANARSPHILVFAKNYGGIKINYKMQL